MPDNPFEPRIKNIGDMLNGIALQGMTPNIGIMDYDGVDVASPADVHLLASKDPVIDEVSVGMSGNLVGSNTVIGAPPLQLPNSAGYPLQWLNIELSPYQDLHGYDAPWPAGGGKNKFDYTAYIQSKVENGITFTVNTDGAVHAIGTSTTRCQIYWRISNAFAKTLGGFVLDVFQSNITGFTAMLEQAGGDYTQFASQTGGTGATIQSTISEVTTDVNFIIRCESGVTIDSTFYPMIRPSDSTHDYAPYSNICPILGTDKVNLFVEESYDPAATPKAVITFDNTLYGGTYDAVTGQGTIDRAVIDLGTLSYTKYDVAQGTLFRATVTGIKRIASGSDIPNILCSQYATKSNVTRAEKSVSQQANSIEIDIIDSSYSDAATFKTAMDGVQLVFELATQIPFNADGHSIPTPRGSATTWATAEDGTVDSMSVTYIQNE